MTSPLMRASPPPPPGEGDEGAGRAGVGPAVAEVGDEPPAAGGTLQEEAAAEGEVTSSLGSSNPKAPPWNRTIRKSQRLLLKNREEN